MTMNADEAEKAAFEEHEAPSWDADPVARDAAVRWHLRGFQAGVEFARRSETLASVTEQGENR